MKENDTKAKIEDTNGKGIHVDIVSVRLVRESSIGYEKNQIGSTSDAYKLFRELLEDLDRETFIVVSLDTKNRPVSINVAHIGNVNSSIVSPACVIRVALLSNATSILIGHNHPSGNPEPSEADYSITRRLEQACDLMGIKLLDHLIIGDECFVSLREEGVF